MLNRSPQLILPRLLTYQEDWIQAYPPSSGKNILSRLAGASQIVHCPQPPRGKSWYGSAFFRLSASRCDRAASDGRPRILTFRLRFGLRKGGRSLGFHGKSLERRGISPPNGIVCGRLNAFTECRPRRPAGVRRHLCSLPVGGPCVTSCSAISAVVFKELTRLRTSFCQRSCLLTCCFVISARFRRFMLL